MGPLAGFRIIEMAGIGPAPFCGMLLADMGAEVIRVDRRETTDLGLPGTRAEVRRAAPRPPLGRGRREVATPAAMSSSSLVAKADALIEGFRPGVMERLGLGPDDLLADQSQARVRPHDGLRPGRPAGARPRATTSTTSRWPACCTPSAARAKRPCRRSTWSATSAAAACSSPSACVCALLEAQKSGKGQVVDAAMVDGAATLMAADVRHVLAQGSWKDERGVNVLDTGAPWYNVYETKDGKWLAVGAIEKRFYEEFIERLGLQTSDLPKQHDRKGWPDLRAALRRNHHDQDARRVGEDLRGQRRLRRADAVPRRGGRPSPQCRAQHLRQARRRAAARPGAALQPHRARDGRTSAGAAAPTPTPCSRDFGFAAGEIADLQKARYRRSRPENGRTRHGLPSLPSQQEIREAILKICARFGDDYWLAKDRDGGFPDRVPPRHGRRRLARHRHAGGLSAARASASPKPPS